MREAQRCGEDLKLTEDQAAFYDALADNESARQVLGDLGPAEIARESHPDHPGAGHQAGEGRRDGDATGRPAGGVRPQLAELASQGSHRTLALPGVVLRPSSRPCRGGRGLGCSTRGAVFLGAPFHVLENRCGGVRKRWRRIRIETRKDG